MTFKETDSDLESRTQDKLRVKRAISKLQPKLKRKKSISENLLKESDKSKEIRRRPFLRKRKIQKSKDPKDENNDSTDKVRAQNFF